MRSFTVVLSPDPDSGVYSVTVPTMPGAITEGATRDATIAAIADVMAAWLDIAQSEGYGPLEDTPEVIGRQVASVIEDRQAEGWDTTIETTLVRPAAVVQTTGDHFHYSQAGNSLNLSIPDHRSIAPGTLRQIIKTMGLAPDEFLRLAKK